jgi:hypothetical protein
MEGIVLKNTKAKQCIQQFTKYSTKRLLMKLQKKNINDG